MLKKGLFAIGALLIGGYIVALIGNAMSKTPSYVGVKDGRLTPAFAAKPNNITTYEAGAYPKEEPLSYSGDMAAAKARLMQIMNGRARTALETDTDNYLHYTSRSLIFRFVDDVEFLFDDEANVIHFRSSSRSGYSDFGVNQKRMAEIRAAFGE